MKRTIVASPWKPQVVAGFGVNRGTHGPPGPKGETVVKSGYVPVVKSCVRAKFVMAGPLANANRRTFAFSVSS